MRRQEESNKEEKEYIKVGKGRGKEYQKLETGVTKLRKE